MLCTRAIIVASYATLSNMKNNFKGKTFVFLGRSGAGKGTQSEFLRKLFQKNKCHYIYISTGDLGREAAKKPTIIGQWIGGIFGRGDFFPDYLAIHLWLSELEKKSIDSDAVVIFEGTPRKVAEAKTVDEIMERLRRPPPTPIFLDIDEREAVKRLLARGRADDTPKIIKKRLENFRKYVLPIVKYYGKRVWKINGAGTKEEVRERMLKKLKSKI